jgi:hypothetical protein
VTIKVRNQSESKRGKKGDNEKRDPGRNNDMRKALGTNKSYRTTENDSVS